MKQRENLLALGGLLRGPERGIFTATSGRAAFSSLSSWAPSDDTQSIPIIFVTAGVHDQTVTFRGFDAGAVDFLYKPLNERIVRSKVKVFLDLYRQKQLLQDQLEKLEASQDLVFAFFFLAFFFAGFFFIGAAERGAARRVSVTS